MWNGIWTQRQESETSLWWAHRRTGSSVAMRCTTELFSTCGRKTFLAHTRGWLWQTRCSAKAEHSPAHRPFSAHSCYWLPVITSTLFPQAGTKNNSLLQCEEHCPSALIMGQHTSIWLLRLYHSRNLFTVEHSLVGTAVSGQLVSPPSFLAPLIDTNRRLEAEHMCQLHQCNHVRLHYCSL